MAEGDKASAGVKGVQTLMRGLDILDQVIDGPVKVTELAKNLGLTKSTAHRLAQALRARDYLSIANDGYSLGPKLLQLGAMAHEQVDYVRRARPVMEELAEQTGYCVFLGKREGDWSRHLERITGRQLLRVATAPGDRRQIVETGIGKALLLDAEPASLTRLFHSAHPSASKRDLREWLEEMEGHKQRGIVVHSSKVGDGVRSVAAPIRNAKGEIVIALSIAGASAYLTDAVLAKLVEPVGAAAARISATLGSVGPAKTVASV